MREKWTASIEPVYMAEMNNAEFRIKGRLDRDPERDIRLVIPGRHKQTARWLAKSLMEWAGEEDE